MERQKSKCAECACRPVCGLYSAMGALERCSYFREREVCVERVRAEAHQVVMSMKCGRCGAYVLEQDHLCPQCGASFYGEFI